MTGSPEAGVRQRSCIAIFWLGNRGRQAAEPAKPKYLPETIFIQKVASAANESTRANMTVRMRDPQPSF
jgi:hypothetical protein